MTKRKSGSRCRRVRVSDVERYIGEARAAIRALMNAKTCRAAFDANREINRSVYGAEALLDRISAKADTKKRYELADDLAGLFGAIPEGFDRTRYLCNLEVERERKRYG